MPRVWMYSPHTVVNYALANYVRSLGFEAQLEPEPPADIAVLNLCGQHSPFLPPPPMPTLALLCSGREEEVVELLRLGYRGYYHADGSLEDFPQALKTILAGGVWAESHLLAQALTPVNALRLTPKEAQVLNLLKLGLSNKQIAHRLGNSETTVKSHVSSVLEKLGARSRRDLLMGYRTGNSSENKD